MKLSQWREDNRYTLPAFVKLLKSQKVEVSPRTVHNWEAGHTEPSIAKLEAIRIVTNGQVLPQDFLVPRYTKEELEQADKEAERLNAVEWD